MIGGKLGNIASLLKNAKKIQEMMEQAKTELDKVEMAGEAGAGLVKVTITAQHQVKALTIDETLFQEEKSIIEDLIMAALNDANRKITSYTQEKMMSAGNWLKDLQGE